MDYRTWGYRFLWAALYSIIIGCVQPQTCKDKDAQIAFDTLFLEQKDTQLFVCQREKEDVTIDQIRCSRELEWYKETYDNPYEEEITPTSFH